MTIPIILLQVVVVAAAATECFRASATGKQKLHTIKQLWNGLGSFFLGRWVRVSCSFSIWLMHAGVQFTYTNTPGAAMGGYGTWAVQEQRGVQAAYRWVWSATCEVWRKIIAASPCAVFKQQFFCYPRYGELFTVLPSLRATIFTFSMLPVTTYQLTTHHYLLQLSTIHYRYYILSACAVDKILLGEVDTAAMMAHPEVAQRSIFFIQGIGPWKHAEWCKCVSVVYARNKYMSVWGVHVHRMYIRLVVWWHWNMFVH